MGGDRKGQTHCMGSELDEREGGGVQNNPLVWGTNMWLPEVGLERVGERNHQFRTFQFEIPMKNPNGDIGKLWVDLLETLDVPLGGCGHRMEDFFQGKGSV